MSTTITLRDVVTVCGDTIHVVVTANEHECRVEAGLPAAYRLLWSTTEDMKQVAGIFREERVAVFEVICELIGKARRAL